MIKFFRKIRQNLLSEGKTGKYFKYALGEIILVVIGILIALSINNWNEKRKLEKQERVYYCKIKEDLETDIINILEAKESLEKRVVSSKNTLSKLYNGNYDRTAIMEDYFSATRSTDFFPSKSAIQDITSSGKLENLKLSEFKEAVINHYTDVESHMYVIISNRNESDKYLFSYDSFSELGIQKTDLYKSVFGEELLNQMSGFNWTKNKEHRIYKQFENNMVLSIIISTRELQVLDFIMNSTKQLKYKLESFCD